MVSCFCSGEPETAKVSVDDTVVVPVEAAAAVTIMDSATAAEAEAAPAEVSSHPLTDMFGAQVSADLMLLYCARQPSIICGHWVYRIWRQVCTRSQQTAVACQNQRCFIGCVCIPVAEYIRLILHAGRSLTAMHALSNLCRMPAGAVNRAAGPRSVWKAWRSLDLCSSSSHCPGAAAAVPASGEMQQAHHKQLHYVGMQAPSGMQHMVVFKLRILAYNPAVEQLRPPVNHCSAESLSCSSWARAPQHPAQYSCNTAAPSAKCCAILQRTSSRCLGPVVAALQDIHVHKPSALQSKNCPTDASPCVSGTCRA